MTEAELEVIRQIDELPRKTPSRQLIDLLGTNTLRARVLGKLSFIFLLDQSILTC